MKRLIVFTLECEDSDLHEFQLRQAMEAFSPKYIKTLPKTEHLKEDTFFKKLLDSKKQAQKNIDKYIDSKR